MMKSILRITLLLVVALISVFFFLKPEDLQNGEVVFQGLQNDAMELVGENQKTGIPIGVNQDLENYLMSFFYLLFSLDLFRENSFIKKFCENARKISFGPYAKNLYPGMLIFSSLLGVFCIVSFIDHLPDIATYVESTKVLTSKGNLRGSTINIWSTGWTLVLRDFLGIVFFVGVFRLTLKLKRDPSIPR
jgi:hypothetical protein